MKRSIDYEDEEINGDGETKVVVTALDGYVNVREGAGTNYSIIGTAQNGEELYVTDFIEREEDGKTWLEIMPMWGRSYDHGWIAESQITYLDGGYILPKSNSVFYSDGDLARLNSMGLRFARNEIYARHGRIFKDEGLNNYFENTSWYKAEKKDVSDDELNEYEKWNRDLIVSLENK